MLDIAGTADAILMGPWLGALEPLAPELSQALGVAVGEVLDVVGITAGLRFEAARAGLLEAIGVAVEPHRVERVALSGDELRLTLDNGDEVITDGVVLALGGVVAGGVVYDPPERHAGQDLPERGAAPWRLSLECPAELQAHGRVLDVVGSIHGPPLDEVAWPIDADPGFLEAVGVRCEGLSLLNDGAVEARLLAAGDVMADRPRTVLQAVFSGIRAGASVAGEPGALSA